jgi:hypothetical protein
MNAFTYASSSGQSHLRTYLAGAGATASLTAGALVAFLSVATFVAFNGFPSGGTSTDAGTAYLDSSGTAAARAAAAALGVGHAAVTRTAGSGAPNRGPSPGGPSGGSTGGAAPTGAGTGQIGGTPIAPPPGAVPSPSTSRGPVEGAVDYVNQAAAPLGASVPSSPSGTVDRTARSTLNAASPGLGGQVSRTGSRLVNGVPGP